MLLIFIPHVMIKIQPLNQPDNFTKAVQGDFHIKHEQVPLPSPSNIHTHSGTWPSKLN